MKLLMHLALALLLSSAPALADEKFPFFPSLLSTADGRAVSVPVQGLPLADEPIQGAPVASVTDLRNETSVIGAISSV